MINLPKFKLEHYFAKWEFTAKYHMCASDVQSMSIKQLLALANNEDKQNWENLHLGYTETFGSPELRQNICNTYQDLQPDNIITFAGAEEGLFACMNALLTKDDHAIVITPNYQSAESLPLSICSTTGVALDAQHHWDLDLQKIHDAIQANTKLISINFPNNPTGKILQKEILLELINIADKHGIYIFSDEVYRLLEREQETRLPQLADIYQRGISLNVMSKAYGLPGLRLGWIACRDQSLLKQMESIKHYLSICCAAPSEQLSIIALKARDTILEKNRQLVNSNLVKLTSFLNKYQTMFSWHKPQGSCVAYIRYLGNDGVEHFTDQLVHETGVLLLTCQCLLIRFKPNTG